MSWPKFLIGICMYIYNISYICVDVTVMISVHTHRYMCIYLYNFVGLEFLEFSVVERYAPTASTPQRPLTAINILCI